jgi:hypothetical protein
MLRIELDGRLADLNPASRPSSASPGRALGAARLDAGRPRRRRLPARVVRGGGGPAPPGRIEIRFSTRWRERAGQRRRGRGARRAGRPQFAIAVVEDMTERSRLELQLRLAQKLESMGRLAAGIAHEINTPIQFVGDHASFLATAITSCWVSATTTAPCATRPRREGCPARTAPPAGPGSDPRAHPAGRARTPWRRPSRGGPGREHRPGHEDLRPPARGQRRNADVNAALRSTLTVAANQLKYVADVTTELQPLPPVPCYLSGPQPGLPEHRGERRPRHRGRRPGDRMQGGASPSAPAATGAPSPSRSPTPAGGSRPRYTIASSIPSSPPRRWGAGPVRAWPSPAQWWWRSTAAP